MWFPVKATKYNPDTQKYNKSTRRKTTNTQTKYNPDTQNTTTTTKDWLFQNNLSERSDMSTRGLLFQ
jgi:hypothetical protein